MGVCFTKQALKMDVTNLSVVIDQRSNSSSLDNNAMSQTDLQQKKTKAANKEINKYMKDVEKKEKKIYKLLLLGSGSSGKSTLFRQIEYIHSEDKQYKTLNNKYKASPLTDCDNTNYKRHIRVNCIDGLLKLLRQSYILSKAPYNKHKCMINVQDEKIADAITILADLNKIFDDGGENNADISVAGQTMRLLWQLDGIKETFKNRQYFSLPENIDYFLDKIHVIMIESEEHCYVPSLEDILNARVQTTGFIERTYLFNDFQLNMFDVGGQRNERKKWLQLFDNVNAVIFVAALNHYCTVLFEEESVNGMQESLQLFEETVNSKWFSSDNTQWILFFNKNDLFIKRLKDDKIPLQTCFGDEFNGANYCGNEAEFEACYVNAMNFIKGQYLSRINDAGTRTNIAIHITVATNKLNIQNAFNGVRDGIIRKNLKYAGYGRLN